MNENSVNTPTGLGTPSSGGGSSGSRSKQTGCCGGSCMSKRSTTVNHQQHRPDTTANPKISAQVEELEKEVQKQKDLRVMYKKRTERTQDYLRYCLQKAQDNGFLDLILNKKHDPQTFLLSPNLTSSPRLLSPSPLPLPLLHHSDLLDIVHRAKLNGWYIHPHEIELQEKIGQGSTADIFRGTWRGFDVAVKCLFPDFFLSNESAVNFFAQELDTLSRQRHRFVLHLMGACLEPPDHGWLVTEFLHTTLKEWLHGSGSRRKERTVPLPPIGERLARALEIAMAMHYLHEQNPKLIHRDLKPSNIFMDRAMHVRVADFGHARFLSEAEMAFTGETGTYVYMAPEVIRCEPYDEKCDVYSFGIILNELITGEHPYIETDYGPAKIAMEVGEGNLRPALPKEEISEELIELIRVSWDGDASARPSFGAIVSSLRNVLERIIPELETSTVHV